MKTGEMKVTISKNEVTIKLPISNPPVPSTSGKTAHLFNSGPAMVVPGIEYEGQPVKVQCFVSIPNK